MARELVCFDIGSGGMSAARFNEELECRSYIEVPWQLPLTAETVESAFRQLSLEIEVSHGAAAISISSFMHSFVVFDAERRPQSPVHTWMDGASAEGIAVVRSAIGSEFHQRTGCHYHPMFPVFKLASMKITQGLRIASPKGLLVEALSGNFVEDFGMASSSGLLNIHSATWDSEILQVANLTSVNLPQLMERDAIVGTTSSGTAVVLGSGDGFMANIGSGCESASRIAITLGTSAAVRQMVSTPVLDASVGTFCYRANSGNSFLLGCASSNGGNVLDWARNEFGIATSAEKPKRDIPIFLPWLNGERSLEWNSEMQPQWHNRRPDHTPAELYRSVMEGVLFNLAQYVEVLERNSGIRANQLVLSGNGFLDSAVAPVLAALLLRETLLPESSGLGTLRGTAVNAWRALGHDAVPALERSLARAVRVIPIDDDGLHSRFEAFKKFRGEADGTPLLSQEGWREAPGWFQS